MTCFTPGTGSSRCSKHTGQQQLDQQQHAGRLPALPACQRASRVWAVALGLLPQSDSTTCTAQQPSGDSHEHGGDSAAPPTAAAGAASSAPALQQLDSRTSLFPLPSAGDQRLLQQLCRSAAEPATDAVTCADVQRLSGNEQFFVFEEAIRSEPGWQLSGRPAAAVTMMLALFTSTWASRGT